MSRGYTRQGGFGAREAFTVEARTYPKVWRDGTVSDIEKAGSRDEKRYGSYTREEKVKAFGDSFTEIIPGSVNGAVKEAKRIAGEVYDTLKNELPSHVFDGLSVSNKVVENKSKYGDTVRFEVQLAFKSPKGTVDVRTFQVGVGDENSTDIRDRAAAVLQLITENGSERREVSGGKQTRIEQRRQKED